MQGIPHSISSSPLGYLPPLQITTKVPIVTRCETLYKETSAEKDTIEIHQTY